MNFTEWQSPSYTIINSRLVNKKPYGSVIQYYGYLRMLMLGMKNIVSQRAMEGYYYSGIEYRKLF